MHLMRAQLARRTRRRRQRRGQGEEIVDEGDEEQLARFGHPEEHHRHA